MLDIQKTLKAFSNQKVLIIGDVMIDRYLFGHTDRMSPEAPVPVVDLNNKVNRLGGAANVALNVKALGAYPLLVSVVGKDRFGESFLELLPQHGIESTNIIQSKSRKTTVKTRIIAQQQHLLRVDDEDKHDLDKAEASAILQKVQELLELNQVNVILFQDYNKGLLSKQVIREVMLEAIKYDIPTVVDPKFNNFWEYKRATLIKPNLKEIRQAIGKDFPPTLEELKKCNAILENRLGSKLSLITLSEKGIFYGSPGDHQIVPTQKRDIVDVCGAGDTVISVAALGLACALTMKEISQLANLAGGQVCEQVGVVPVNARVLEKEYKQFITSL